MNGNVPTSNNSISSSSKPIQHTHTHEKAKYEDKIFFRKKEMKNIKKITRKVLFVQTKQGGEWQSGFCISNAIARHRVKEIHVLVVRPKTRITPAHFHYHSIFCSLIIKFILLLLLPLFQMYARECVCCVHADVVVLVFLFESMNLCVSFCWCFTLKYKQTNAKRFSRKHILLFDVFWYKCGLIEFQHCWSMYCVNATSLLGTNSVKSKSSLRSLLWGE